MYIGYPFNKIIMIYYKIYIYLKINKDINNNKYASKKDKNIK